jgi:hypothetical protein
MYSEAAVLGQLSVVAPVVEFGEPPLGPVNDPVKFVNDLVVVTVKDLVVEELVAPATGLLVEVVVVVLEGNMGKFTPVWTTHPTAVA